MNYVSVLVHLFFAFLAISSGSVFGSIFDKKYEEVVPITIMASILFLYLFYILNILFVGLYILWGVMLIIYSYFIYKFFTADKIRRKKIINNIVTPGFLIFVLVFILITLVTRGRYVLLWDELRLWGAYPKILYYNGGLQLGSNVQLMGIMQSYEPGMPLFQFFFAKSAGYFAESDLFLSYGIVGAATLIPFTKKITWEKFYLIPIFAFLIFMFPLMLANSNLDGLTYYNTLFIDCMIGIYFCYTLYLSVTKMYDGKSKYILFLLGIGVLTLLKDTGILFAIFSCIAFIINEFILYKKPKLTNKRMIIFIILPIIMVLLLFGSWKGIQRIYNTSNLYASSMENGEIQNFLTSPTLEQKKIIKDFIFEVNNSPIIVSNSKQITNFLNYKNLMLLLIIFYIIIVYLKPKKERKKYIVTVLSYFVGGLVFTIGTLMVYLFSLHIVTCFPRYMSTIFTGGFLLLSILIIEDILEHKNITSKYKLFINLVIIVFILIMPIKLPTMIDSSFLEEKKYQSAVYSDRLKKYIKNNKETYALIFNDKYLEDFSHVIYDHHIYMDLIDEGFKFGTNILINSQDNKEELLKKLSDINYVYFIVINESDSKIFSEVLNEELSESTLYKVNKNNNLITLEKLE